MVGEGRQVFVVCPMVEENDELAVPLKSAQEHAEELQRTFPDLHVACIHGRMKAKEKDFIKYYLQKRKTMKNLLM